MRQLSFKMAQSCEWAVEERCRCRCGGKAHGKRRGMVANLKEKDPHYVPPSLITLEELRRFFIVRLEERQGKLFVSREEKPLEERRGVPEEGTEKEEKRKVREVRKHVCPHCKAEFSNFKAYSKHNFECPARNAAYWRLGKRQELGR